MMMLKGLFRQIQTHSCRFGTAQGRHNRLLSTFQGIDDWQDVYVPWRETAGQLNGLPEVADLAKQERITTESVELARRTVEICEASMGVESEFTACALWLANQVAAAAGHFEYGAETLGKLKKNPVVDKEAVGLAADRLDLLRQSPDVQIQFKDHLTYSSIPVNQVVYTLFEEKEKDLEDRLVTEEVFRRFINNLAASEIIESEKANAEFTNALVMQSPFRSREYARVLIARAVFMPGLDQDKAAGDLSKAISILDSLKAHLDESVTKNVNMSNVDKISQTASRQVLMLNNRALLGTALASLARQYHVSGQAVTSEGLYRSAIDHLLAMVQTKDSFLRNAIKPSLRTVANEYSKLLDDWENRERDAANLRNRYPLQETDSKLFSLLLIDSWLLFKC